MISIIIEFLTTLLKALTNFFTPQRRREQQLKKIDSVVIGGRRLSDKAALGDRKAADDLDAMFDERS